MITRLVNGFLLPILVLISITGCAAAPRLIDPKSLEGQTILEIGHANGHILYVVPKDAAKS